MSIKYLCLDKYQSRFIMSKQEKKPLTIMAQPTGFKNLKIEGGWRLQLDLYESRLTDILTITALVNGRKNLKITIEEEEDDNNQKKGE